MTPQTTTRGLLGIFPRGADPPTTDPRASTPPVRSPASSSLQAISVAKVRGRSARGGASSRKGPWEERRGGTWEGGRNGDALGRPHGDTDTGRKTTARERMMAEEGSRQRGHDDQVSSDGDRGGAAGPDKGIGKQRARGGASGAITHRTRRRRRTGFPRGSRRGANTR